MSHSDSTGWRHRWMPAICARFQTHGSKRAKRYPNVPERFNELG